MDTDMDLDKEIDMEMDMYTYMSKNNALNCFFNFAKKKKIVKSATFFE